MISNNLNMLLVSCVFLFVLIHSSFAIQCWDCESNTDVNCGDPFNNRTITAVDCYEKCRKIVKNVNGNIQISRGCHEQVRLYDSELFDCYTRGCNSGLNHIPFIFTIISMPILISVFNLLIRSS